MADFKLRLPIGTGSFGQVWLADDRAVGEERAVKIIGMKRVLDPTNLYAEAHALAAVKHDNIVAVKDAGKLDSLNIYISMEYLPLGSVERMIDKGRLTVRSAVKYGADICRALECAHQLGYLHRDVKPGNMLIAPLDSAKLSDFGIATRVTPLGTATGVGYNAHRAPEMIVHNLADARSDIYALGVSLFRMVNAISGAAFRASWPLDLDASIVAGRFPSRAAYDWRVPRSLRTVINRAMNVDPAKRYQSAAEFRHALEQQRLSYDWEFETNGAAECWKGLDEDSTVIITLQRSKKGDWVVECRKGMRGAKPRRIACDGGAFSTLSDASVHVFDLVKRITANGK